MPGPLPCLPALHRFQVWRPLFPLGLAYVNGWPG